MKVGDTVRIRKTDIVGTIARTIDNSGRHYTVKIDGFPPIVLYDDEIEPVKPAAIVNPCVMCGAETPEGRIVCGRCEKT
jgi:hypothetical protein